MTSLPPVEPPQNDSLSSLVLRERATRLREDAADRRDQEFDRDKAELDRLRASLASQEQKLAQQETSTGERVKKCEEREARARERDKELLAQKSELEQREVELSRQEQANRQEHAELIKLRKQVLAREAEASFAAHKENREAQANLLQQADKIRAEIQELEQKRHERLHDAQSELAAWREAEIQRFNQMLARRMQEEEQRIAEERERLNAGLASLAASRTQQLAEIASLREKEIAALTADLEKMRHEHDTRFAVSFAAASKNLVEREETLRSERAALEADRRAFDRDRDDLQFEIERRVEQQASRAIADLKYEQEKTRILSAERSRLEEKLKGQESILLSFGNLTAQDVERDRIDQRARIEWLENELAKRPNEVQARTLMELQEALDRERLERQKLEQYKLTAEATLAYKHKAEVAVEGLRDQKRTLEDQLKFLRQTLDIKEKAYKEYLELTKPADKPAAIVKDSDAYNLRLGDLRNYPFQDLPHCGKPQQSETEWLNRIEAGIVGAQLSYPRRLLYAFHTCLKTAQWSPMTVLAGVSGTGKTLLPQVYARFGGLLFQSASVEPNWQGPQDVFGFFNYMDNRFNATELARALVQSQEPPPNGLKDRLLIILLDEMNLAHVERYLSELLSKWELRRSGGEKGNALVFDLGSNCPKLEVPLGLNVLFTGTINEDETTHALSDKVLDRGNTLYFPRPKELKSREQLELRKQEFLLPWSEWRNWLRSPASLEAVTEKRDIYRKCLERINGYLGKVEKGIGHRVWQSVEIYMANHPGVIEALEGNDDRLSGALEHAFEDQMVQRVMPKLRGIDLEGSARTECLDRIAAEIAEVAPGLTRDFAAAMESGRSFYWRQSDYLEPESPVASVTAV